MTLTIKVKVENFFNLQLKSYNNKTVIDFKFGRHEDLSTLKSVIHFSGRYILMSTEITLKELFTSVCGLGEYHFFG